MKPCKVCGTSDRYSNGNCKVCLRKRTRERSKRVGRKHGHRTPEMRRAHYAVYRAVASGLLVRPSECSRCGTPCKPDAAHVDYSKQLDVTWLCRVCHTTMDMARFSKPRPPKVGRTRVEPAKIDARGDIVTHTETARPDMVRPGEAATMLGVSRLKVYRMLKDGELRSVKHGNTRLIYVDSIRAFLAGLEQQGRAV